MSEWIRVADRLPEEGTVVETKIDDEKGLRNEQTLKRQGRLWFVPDGTMYVYYAPTHWRELSHVKALVEKWRAKAKFTKANGRWAEAITEEICADELEAAIAKDETEAE